MSASARKGVNAEPKRGRWGGTPFAQFSRELSLRSPRPQLRLVPPTYLSKLNASFVPPPPVTHPGGFPPLMPAAGGPPQACSSPSSGSWASRPPARGPAPRKQASAPGSGFPSPGCGGSRPSKPGAGSLSRRPPGRGWLGGRGVLSPRAPRLRLGPRSAARCPARPSGRWDRPVPRRRAGP